MTNANMSAHTPGQWRMLNSLYEAGRVVDHPRSAHSSGKASLDRTAHARRTVTRQAASAEDLIDLEVHKLVKATLGGDWIDYSLADNPQVLRQAQPRGIGAAGAVYVTLTRAGADVVCFPANLLIRGMARRRRYLVSDVTKGAGISGQDVKQLLIDMEAAQMIEARNDQGPVELSMFKRSVIPPQLRLSLLPGGAKYLHRK